MLDDKSQSIITFLAIKELSRKISLLFTYRHRFHKQLCIEICMDNCTSDDSDVYQHNVELQLLETMEIYNETEQHHSTNEGFKPTTIRSPRH